MSLYNENGERISTAALCESMEYAKETQQIESGQFYRYVYDLFGVYGGMNK